MTTVLVTDGIERSSLAVVRSLGRAGYRVHVCATRRRSLAGSSRHAFGRHWVPDALTEPAHFVEAIGEIARRVGAEVLLPLTDVSVSAVLAARSAFEGMTLPLPDLAQFEGVSDKGRVVRVARTLGICTPGEVRIEEPLGQECKLPEEIVCPAVVKPTRSVATGADGTRLRTSVRHAATTEELRKVLSVLPPSAFPVLVQERIRGDGVGVFLLRWDDRLLAAFAHRRIREKPPSGGVSVLRESVPLPAHLLERSLQLLEAFDWKGAAMVEYKEDAEAGEPVLMEVNGRFWGSLQLAIDAGVDFPGLLVAAATGQNPEPVLDYRVGVRSRWFWGDVDHLIARLRYSRETLDLPPEAPGRAVALLNFLASSGPGVRGEVLRWDDPMPALAEGLDWMARR